MVGQAVPPAPRISVRALVGRMTLDEKVSLVHGARDPKDLGQAGYWPGLARLGIPPLRLADGLAVAPVARSHKSAPSIGESFKTVYCRPRPG